MRTQNKSAAPVRIGSSLRCKKPFVIARVSERYVIRSLRSREQIEQAREQRDAAGSRTAGAFMSDPAGSNSGIACMDNRMR